MINKQTEKPPKPIHPRKLEIVAAAVSCFLEQGYHQTGVRDIAQKANVSLGNLYNHFKGKEAVLAFIADMEGDELQEFTGILSQRISSPIDTLQYFIKTYAAYTSRAENALLGIEILSEALRNTVIAEVFGENRKLLIAALSDLLCVGKKNGVFVDDFDAEDVACMILDTIEGHGLRTLLTGGNASHSVKTLERFILKAVQA